ncbi:mechanosensitive ion channel domain-containing protein [Actinomycetaceae bacterium MB13-C1-2]|nr:mechanosensitive ion channel domain-containing protein [Actinomycetaceae bacterium MB13-C1-2]
MSEQLESWLGLLLALLVIAVLLVLLSWLLKLATRALRPKHPDFVSTLAASRKYLLTLTGLILGLVSIAATWPHASSKDLVVRIMVIASIFATAALATSITNALIDRIRTRHPIEGDNDQQTMRLHTQLSVIRAFANAAIWLLAIGISFFTIPGAHAFGASVLASAGVASVIIGVAAQSVLGNVFAGMQLALNGAIRVNDLVVANGEQGRIETINLTTVVMRLGDGRCLVLPSNYFTTTPFENWTKETGVHIGSIRFDVDWRISPSAIREQLNQVLSGNQLWDGKTASVAVEDATGGMVRIRVTVSSGDENDLMNLRLQVREQLVEWLASTQTTALPTQRVLEEPAN